MSATYFVYILASAKNGTLYVGMTDDLAGRVHEHRNGRVAGFTKEHGVTMLVYYEAHSDVELANQRETQLKKWNRRRKVELIETLNPGWHDLYETLNN